MRGPGLEGVGGSNWDRHWGGGWLDHWPFGSARGAGQGIPVWLTLVVGVVAALIGTSLASVVRVADTHGIDWVELIVQIGARGCGGFSCGWRVPRTARSTLMGGGHARGRLGVMSLGG
jgi:hypothetical protein